jgi:Bacterial dnaA protein helix-turn-helix
MGMLPKERLRKKKAVSGLSPLPELELGLVNLNGHATDGLRPTTAEQAMEHVALLREELYAWEQAIHLKMGPTPKLGDDPVLVIQKVTAMVVGVDPFEMYISDRGNENLVWARQLAMYIAYVDYRLGSTTSLATRFNRLDHGTISYAKKVVLVRIGAGDFGGRFKGQYDLCLEHIVEFLPMVKAGVLDVDEKKKLL